ncbi:MAG: DUF3108 domain-containing protein [Methylacidiphilales bacterium]|nr:DUF3108 domain-containing protein [Candidatus Methylacidiphilales bacterium]
MPLGSMFLRWGMCGMFFCFCITWVQAQRALSNAHVPWVNGEVLIYDVKWGLVKAAEALFKAEDLGDRWKFSLNLKTVGLVDAFYPVNSRFVSITEKGYWRSMGYFEDRNENRRVRRTSSTVDYWKKVGVFLNQTTGEKRMFRFKHEILHDLGSVLYGTRLADWERAGKRRVCVYERGKIKNGWIYFEKRVVESVAGWPKQRLWCLYGEPEPDSDGKVRGNVRMWLTDDKRRIPLYARVKFRWGTFEIELKEAFPYGLVNYERNLGASQIKARATASATKRP